MNDLKKKLIAAAVIGGGSILGFEALKGLGGFALRKSPELYIGHQTKKTRRATESLNAKTDETNRLLAELVKDGRLKPKKRRSVIMTRKIEPLA